MPSSCSIGYPCVLISWSGEVITSGASIRYSVLGHRERMYPAPEELSAMFILSVSVFCGFGSTHDVVSFVGASEPRPMRWALERRMK